MLIYEIDVCFSIIWIDFATTLVNWHKHGFNTASCLSHKRYTSCWSNSQTSNVSTSVLLHISTQFWIQIIQAIQEWVILLYFVIKHWETSTLTSHFNRRLKCANCNGLLDFLCKLCCFWCTILNT